MDTNKATADAGLGVPRAQKQDAQAFDSGLSEPGPGPGIIPVVAGFGYWIQFG